MRKLLAVTLLAGMMACDFPTPNEPEPPPPPPIPPGPPVPPPPPQSPEAQLRNILVATGVWPPQPAPPRNAALVSLGQALMFDKILSGNRDISCATCHHPASASGDGLTLSIGTGGTGTGSERALGSGQFLARNAPALFNLRDLIALFWDGRVGVVGGVPFVPPGVTLPPGITGAVAAQAMLPVTVREEMRGHAGDVDVLGNANELATIDDDNVQEIWRAVMRRLLTIPEYVAMFEAAFPGVPREQLGFQHAANAIAAFEVDAFTTGLTPLDRFVAGEDAALRPEQLRGGLLFTGRARCISCHSGPLLAVPTFLNIGVPQVGPGRAPGTPLDWGQGGATGRDNQRFLFRTAPLRNVELTAPYMHNGAYATLTAVVRHYNDVERANRTYDVSQLPPALRSLHRGDETTISTVLATLDVRLRTPFGLSEQEIADIVEFLKSLTDPRAGEMTAVAPGRVPSGLPID